MLPMDERLKPGLYIVATPIGNLSDLSPRAADTLARADLIAVEDSRVTAKLLQHIGVKRPMAPYHDHNADRVRPGLIARMASEAVALVSDAGTPLISDPGYKLVRDARAAGVPVTTIPGPSAAIAALTLAGLPTDRFAFFGFLPPKGKAARHRRGGRLQGHARLLRKRPPPRRHPRRAGAKASATARPRWRARSASGSRKPSTGTLSELAARYAEAPPKGEIVIVVGPPGEAEAAGEAEIDAALREAMTRLSPSRAAAEVAESLGLPRRAVYERAQALK